MLELRMTAPTFTHILESRALAEQNAVAIVFGTDDRQKFTLAFSASCVPLAVVALQSHLGELPTSAPTQTSREIQGLRATGIQTAMKQDSTPALILNLAGGGELPIDMRRDVLAKIYAAIGQLLSMGDLDRHH